MDSRPAMAIFELLDYIVNEVCALGLQVLLSGSRPAYPGCFLGRGCRGLLLCSPQSVGSHLASSSCLRPKLLSSSGGKLKLEVSVGQPRLVLRLAQPRLVLRLAP